MPNGHPAGRPAQPDATPGWAARARAPWPPVRIDFVETRPCAAGRHVRAVVHLAGLMPVDVVVGLTPGPVRSAVACASERRMWSFESLDNGRVVFERLIPHDEAVAGDAWSICVRPAGDAEGRPVVYPFRLPHADDPHAESTDAASVAPGAARGSQERA